MQLGWPERRTFGVKRPPLPFPPAKRLKAPETHDSSQLSPLTSPHMQTASVAITGHHGYVPYVLDAVREFCIDNLQDYHGMYGSISCCISHWPRQWIWRFSTPSHRSETPQPIFMKLEIYNSLPNMTPHAKFQRATLTWVVWANSQFDAWLSFFRFFATPTGRIVGHIPRTNAALYVVPAKKVAFGVRRIKF